MITAISNILWITLLQLSVMILPGFLLTLLMSRVSTIFAHQMYRIIGSRKYLLTFGWLGTAVHELSHAIIAIIFGHKIDEIKLFQTRSDSNRLGYVRLRYDKNSVYQRVGNLFIGVAPVFMGAIIIFLSAKLLVPDVSAVISEGGSILGEEDWLSASLGSFFSIFLALIDLENFFHLEYYLFLYILFCVGSAMTLSRADLKGSKSGFAVFIGVLFIINIYREVLYSFSYPFWLINFTFFIYNLMAGVLLLQLVMILLLKLFVKGKIT